MYFFSRMFQHTPLSGAGEQAIPDAYWSLPAEKLKKLRSKVTVHSTVLRDGQPKTLPSHRVVPGDTVLLSAASLIPADGLVLEAKDFFVNQAVLTGETFPAEKKAGAVAAKAGLAERSCSWAPA